MNTPSFQDVQFTNGYEFTQGTGYTLPEYAFVTPPELVQNKTLRHAVVIVGGGISGLTLACGLANLALGRRQHCGGQGRLLARHLLHPKITGDFSKAGCV